MIHTDKIWITEQKWNQKLPSPGTINVFKEKIYILKQQFKSDYQLQKHTIFPKNNFHNPDPSFSV